MGRLVLLLIATVVLIWLVMFVVFATRRLRMESRARALLAEHPDAETTSLYLEFTSARPRRRQSEMDAKIAEMGQSGWIFLRASEANPLRTIRSWGGGLVLHFIRPRPRSAMP